MLERSQATGVKVSNTLDRQGPGYDETNQPAPLKPRSAARDLMSQQRQNDVIVQLATTRITTPELEAGDDDDRSGKLYSYSNSVSRESLPTTELLRAVTIAQRSAENLSGISAADSPTRRIVPRSVPMEEANHSSDGSAGSSSGSSSIPDPMQLLLLMRRCKGIKSGLVQFCVLAPTWISTILEIQPTINALVAHGHQDESDPIISDLRGCQVKTQTHPSDGKVIEITTRDRKIVLLKPQRGQEFHEWLAALLFWQPIKSSPVSPNAAIPYYPVSSPPSTPPRAPPPTVSPPGSPPAVPHQHPPLNLRLRKSSIQQESPTSSPQIPSPSPSSSTLANATGSVIKAGRIVVLKPHTSSNDMYLSFRSPDQYTSKQVSVILKDTGELSILHEADGSVLNTIPLSKLNRTDIQLLDRSLFKEPYCMVIYSAGLEHSSPVLQADQTIYLAFEKLLDVRVWYVLMRCFTIPELYGPPSGDLSQGFRIHRSLFVRVIDARGISPFEQVREKELHTYCEVLIDGELRARTAIQRGTARPFWREDFRMNDIATIEDDVVIAVKQFRRGKDLVIGEVRLDVNTAEAPKEEVWLPIVYTSYDGLTYDKTGELRVQFQLDEQAILMGDEFNELVAMISDFDNHVALHLAKTGPELETLALHLCRIFEADGVVVDYLKFLASQEIAIPALTPNGRKDDGAFQANAQQFQSDQMDANVLFRGNSLLTKTLDIFMRRTEPQYLEDTIGDILRRIVNEEIKCEVDPSKLHAGDDLRENWRVLNSLTREIWTAIYDSAANCPPRFKAVFYHIRSRIIARYGDSFSGLRFTSVSRFLFLRYFCLAVLNPKMFSIVRENPEAKCQRTLTLIAKALQGLANMSRFGTKESWMAPMNEFLSSAMYDFQSFIDTVCTPTTDSTDVPLQPALATPLMILSRLPPTSREGIPTLPFLLDKPKECVYLIHLWLRLVVQSRHGQSHTAIDFGKLSPSLRQFHEICVRLEAKTRHLVKLAEQWEEDTSDGESVTQEAAGLNIDRRSSRSRSPAVSSSNSDRKFWSLDELSGSPIKAGLGSTSKKMGDAMGSVFGLKKKRR